MLEQEGALAFNLKELCNLPWVIEVSKVNKYERRNRNWSAVPLQIPRITAGLCHIDDVLQFYGLPPTSRTKRALHLPSKHSAWIHPSLLPTPADDPLMSASEIEKWVHYEIAGKDKIAQEIRRRLPECDVRGGRMRLWRMSRVSEHVTREIQKRRLRKNSPRIMRKNCLSYWRARRKFIYYFGRKPSPLGTSFGRRELWDSVREGKRDAYEVLSTQGLVPESIYFLSFLVNEGITVRTANEVAGRIVTLKDLPKLLADLPAVIGRLKLNSRSNGP